MWYILSLQALHMKKQKRCSWVPEGDALYEEYHDTEWGVPTSDDRGLFEFLVLESAQAGLSWRTILSRRDGYRNAFFTFDPKKVARMTDVDVERLMQDTAIIRNKAKIKAAINNAKHFLEVQNEFGTFSKYAWSFVNDEPVYINHRPGDKPITTFRESDLFAKDMKRRGFTFFGPTIAYAYMQATGMVNSHEKDCFRHPDNLL